METAMFFEDVKFKRGNKVRANAISPLWQSIRGRRKVIPDDYIFTYQGRKYDNMEKVDDVLVFLQVLWGIIPSTSSTHEKFRDLLLVL